MTRIPILTAAAFGLGFVLTTALSAVSPESQLVVATPPVSKTLAIAIITAVLTGAYVASAKSIGIWKAAAMLTLGYCLLVFDKWLFGNFSTTRAVGGFIWSACFWYGLAAVDHLIARKALNQGS